MSVTDNQTHPSAMSDEQKAELRQLVEEEEAELHDGDKGEDVAAAAAAAGGKEEEAAGADAGAGGGAKDKGKDNGAAAEGGAAGGDQGKPKEGKDGAAAADAGAAGEGEDGAGKPGKGDREAFVPKQQFDGVLADLRATRQEVQTLKALATGKREPLPERDFDAEDKALDDAEAQLDAKYDTEGMADEEYRQAQRDIEKRRRALDRERNKYELHAQLLADQEDAEKGAAEQAAKAAAESWQTEVVKWQDSLGDWLKNPVRRSTVDNTMAMMNADPELAQLDHAAYLAKLDEYLRDAFPNYPRTDDAGAGKEKDLPPATQRQKLQAQRAAEASNAPPRIEGGVGNRGTRTEDIDLENMPLGTFKKLPKERQDELLGLN